jgi:hypothetical protein
MAAVIIMPIGGSKDNLVPDEPSHYPLPLPGQAERFKLWLG